MVGWIPIIIGALALPSLIGGVKEAITDKPAASTPAGLLEQILNFVKENKMIFIGLGAVIVLIMVLK